jgi:hypothetical protein
MRFPKSLLAGLTAAALLATPVLAAPAKLQIGSPLNPGSFAETYLKEFQNRVAEGDAGRG